MPDLADIRYMTYQAENLLDNKVSIVTREVQKDTFSVHELYNISQNIQKTDNL